MTVFRGFLTITKRNLNTMIMYLVIFLSICLIIQKMLLPETDEAFEQQSLNIAVIDRDGGQLARGLADYLKTWHTIKDIPDDKSILQDRLFYREIYYIVTIPDDFEEKYLTEDASLSVTKVPGSTSGYYVDQQINTFLSNVRVMTAGGFSLPEAIAYVQENTEASSEVTLFDKNGYGSQTPEHAFMYQYMPYIILSILCYTLSYIMIAFGNPEVRKRMLISSVSARSMNLQLILGYGVIGLAVWGICSLMPVLLYHKSFLSDPHLPYYLVNSLLLTLVGLSIAFLIGTLVHSAEVVSAVVNVITLGMSFSCGVFVPLDIIGKGLKAIAHFLPVYWYEINNTLISGNRSFSPSQLTGLYTGYAIQLLFAAAFIGITLVIRHTRRQADS